MYASSLFLWGHRSQSLCSMFMYEGLGTSSLDYSILPRANRQCYANRHCCCSIVTKCGLVVVKSERGELSLGKYTSELPRLFLCERPSSIAPRWVKRGSQELEYTQSGKESVQLPAVHHCGGANRGRILSLQSRYSAPFINQKSFLSP